MTSKTGERDRADRDYATAKDDLEKITLAHPTLNPAQAIPQPSDDKGIENTIDEITKHFEGAKATAFESARDLLGERFDPANPALLSDLERNVGRALERVSRPQDLASAARLGALRRLNLEELDATEAKIQEVLAEAKALDALAQNPSIAARMRLYARVATWIADHPDPERKNDTCVVCGGDLEHALDPVTGQLVQGTSAGSRGRRSANSADTWPLVRERAGQPHAQCGSGSTRGNGGRPGRASVRSTSNRLRR